MADADTGEAVADAVDTTDDADAATGADAPDGGDGDDAVSADSRNVVVPLRLYKTVTVFSTLFAVVFVLAGFVLLDAATNRATAELSEIDPLLAILGLASLVGGAAVYAFSTRFRAEGMGKSKDESDERSDNG